MSWKQSDFDELERKLDTISSSYIRASFTLYSACSYLNVSYGQLRWDGKKILIGNKVWAESNLKSRLDAYPDLDGLMAKCLKEAQTLLDGLPNSSTAAKCDN